MSRRAEVPIPTSVAKSDTSASIIPRNRIKMIAMGLIVVIAGVMLYRIFKRRKAAVAAVSELVKQSADADAAWQSAIDKPRPRPRAHAPPPGAQHHAPHTNQAVKFAPMHHAPPPPPPAAPVDLSEKKMPPGTSTASGPPLRTESSREFTQEKAAAADKEIAMPAADFAINGGSKDPRDIV